MAETTKQIYFAGGCFWGAQAYFSRVPGVINTEVGYANGSTKNPTYYDIKHTGHVETVLVIYDSSIVSLKTLLRHFFNIIDPTVINRQGGDVGTQYRTGIYFTDKNDEEIIKEYIKREQCKYDKLIVTEVMRLEGFYTAEEYHQDYLDKNPEGYCHISLDKINNIPYVDEDEYYKPDSREIKNQLTDIQYKVTQENYTEMPFENEYWAKDEKGIYVDIVTGEPLFFSTDKFDAGCGWPSFTKPISEDSIKEKEDLSHGRIRTEVRSRVGDSHLGHVFNDGPKDETGLRYCINSAAIRFIPIDKMEESGYGEYIRFLEDE